MQTVIVGHYELRSDTKNIKDFIGDKYQEVKKFILSVKDLCNNEVIAKYYFDKEKDLQEEIHFYLDLDKRKKL